MSRVPAILAIYDHQVIGATMTARRTLGISIGKDAARAAADPKRGRYFAVLKTPGTGLFEQHTDDEALVLRGIEYLFERNDCSRLGMQWMILPDLELKIRAIRERFIPLSGVGGR